MSKSLARGCLEEIRQFFQRRHGLPQATLEYVLLRRQHFGLRVGITDSATERGEPSSEEYDEGPRTVGACDAGLHVDTIAGQVAGN
jgi:hypothetical protein